MKQFMQGLLLLLLGIALASLYLQGWEQGMLILVIFGFSARAYRLANDFRQGEEREVYDKQMKVVQTFTLACVLISFYWPESMFHNAAILVCLVLHCVINRYVKGQDTAA